MATAMYSIPLALAALLVGGAISDTIVAVLNWKEGRR